MSSRKISHEWLRKVIESVNPRAGRFTIAPNTELLEVGALDSYAIVQLVLALEEKLGFSFDYADITARNFRTIERLTTLLTAKYSCTLE